MHLFNDDKRIADRLTVVLPVPGRLREDDLTDDDCGCVHIEVETPGIVRALGPGHVLRFAAWEGAGRSVTLAGPGSYTTAYRRLIAVGVRIGDRVRCGQGLGLLGGRVLELEMRFDGKLVDPRLIILIP